MTHILQQSQLTSVQNNEFSVCNDPICTWDFVSSKVGVHRFFKNLGATSKFYVPEVWHRASSLMRTPQILAPYKI